MCVCVRACVRVCVRMSNSLAEPHPLALHPLALCLVGVAPPDYIYIPPSIVFHGGSSDRQTWTCYEVGGLDLKIRLWSGEARGS